MCLCSQAKRKCITSSVVDKLHATEKTVTGVSAARSCKRSAQKQTVSDIKQGNKIHTRIMLKLADPDHRQLELPSQISEV